MKEEGDVVAIFGGSIIFVGAEEKYVLKDDDS